mmetsp:Transcript_65880/g.190015  ORF Transcript_65880/g.190015 Transcript_65880/m.190015 type:complete len:432 (+) Transcript_65880:671-1966(+)
MLRHPNRCRKLLEEVWEVLPELPRLPATSFPISELSKALEYMSKGVHIGKILIEIDDGVSVLPTAPCAVAGPRRDAVTQALRAQLGAKDSSGGLVCVPDIGALRTVDELRVAQVVVTASRAVVAIAESVCPEAIRIEVPRWEPLPAIDDWLALGGEIVAVEEEAGGDLREWLVEVVTEMAGPIAMDEAFEDAGLDSLSLISLARRLTAKVGKSVSVADLYDHPTPQQLLDSFIGRPQAQVSRPKALCLHGFRSNKDAMALQMAPFVSAAGMVEWLFINAPRQASGPPDPKIPSSEGFEWWGQRGGAYETGWLAEPSQYDGFEETLPAIRALSPVGLVGFSQGGAMAAIADCAWTALFSAVEPRGLRHRDTPSFHCWDTAEEYCEQCVRVSTFFSKKEVHHHKEGHTVPRERALVAAFAAFVAKQHPSHSSL